MSVPHLLQDLQRLLGQTDLARLTDARLLMVGAGGIGCEILKNLVLAGFASGPRGSIDVIDLDTIDLSNLNRQFLFQREHVGLPKSTTACQSALKFQPALAGKLHPHLGSILDMSQYGISFFRRFDVVIGALDNIPARRHVNRMCMAAGVPLVESGTTGYLGQVSVIAGGQSECYDCTPPPPSKSFPVCTIRSTPSLPIHCLVWAKDFLLPQLFGSPAETAAETRELEAAVERRRQEAAPSGAPGELDAAGADELEALLAENRAVAALRADMLSDTHAARRRLFDHLFRGDIDRLLALEALWAPESGRTPPTPLDIDQLLPLESGNDHHSGGRVLMRAASGGVGDQQVWSVAENAIVFLDSMQQLALRVSCAAPEAEALAFDKDDDLMMDFVCAAANLRMICFGITPQSRFRARSIAGNIIPAIATTNAIVSGQAVLEIIALLTGPPRAADAGPGLAPSSRTTYLVQGPGRARLMSKERPAPPKPDCLACQGPTKLVLRCDLKVARLGDFIRTSLQEQLELEDPSVSVSSSQNDEARLLADADFDSNHGSTLATLGIDENTFILVEDDLGERQAELFVEHVTDLQESQLLVAATGRPAVPVDLPAKPRPAESHDNEEPQSPAGDIASGPGNDHGDVILLDDGDAIELTADTSTGKRKAPVEDDGDAAAASPASKRRHT
ncbi:hypothetical protein H696_04577 [Fonticula alba]|uniref:SUMO-activating enzyme subunit n=1 Tax=Fonticula alba TaxID=691883 RepID=A0A058Z5E2_FONAL|nr:hypothetical protein H696_04577 [Fonticula alba]KCV69163.1 hypothetical protein H696_04577 [Fonticula alba]|eukprot:XP_009496734.1 hypothetical protein H696_04577 [Fonticula alba]